VTPACRTCPPSRNGDTISGVKAGARVHGAVALILGLILGCKGSLNADANVNGKGASAAGDAELHGSASGEGEGKGEMTRSAGTSGVTSTSSLAAIPASSVLLGARHDLKLRSGQATANCQCLAVAVGGSHGSAMLWSSTTPDIDERSQMTIALSSDGQACKDEPKNSLGASYWGYRISGNDVVVLVEAARGGRPLTSGAIIPKPVGAGQVYVAPASKKLPYGRPLSGGGMCKIGNPGPARTNPFSALELGDNAPRPTADAKNGGLESSDQTPTTVDLPPN
jgi:hypothetical protein